MSDVAGQEARRGDATQPAINLPASRAGRQRQGRSITTTYNYTTTPTEAFTKQDDWRCAVIRRLNTSTHRRFGARVAGVTAPSARERAAQHCLRHDTTAPMAANERE